MAKKQTDPTPELSIAVKPIWPTKWAIVPQEEVSGISPLPSIWLIADSGRGKSSFGASLPGRLIVADCEDSWAALQYQRPNMTRFDVRAEASKHDYREFQRNMFEAYLTIVEHIKSLPPYTYDCLVIDPSSDLHFGSYFWVPDNGALFGKTPQRYNGREGTMAQWADANLWWENHLTEMKQYVQTVVLISHPKDVYEGRGDNSRKTGQKTFRGANLTNKVSLVLWLYDERDEGPDGPKGKPARWAYVAKQRLTWHVYQKGSMFPRIHDILPKKLIVKDGMTFPELIWNYMDAPRPDYGELNVVHGDPTKQVDPEEERRQRQVERELDHVEALRQAKTEMAERLIEKGFFDNAEDIRDAIIALDLVDDVQDITKLEAVEAKLRKYTTDQAASDEDE